MSANKVSPLPLPTPTTDNNGGNASVGVPEEGASNSDARPKVNPNTKPKLVRTARLRRRITGTAMNLAKIRARIRGRESMGMVCLVSGVSLVLLTLGIFMVAIGDENYIVDVIVLGVLCIVMGIASFVLGMALALKPLYKKNQQLKEEERQHESATIENRTQATSVSPRLPYSSSSRQEELKVNVSHHQLMHSTSRHIAASTSISETPDRTLLDQRNGQKNASSPSSSRGRLSTPSPPLVGGQRKRRSSSASSLDTVDDDSHQGNEAGGHSLDDDIQTLGLFR